MNARNMDKVVRVLKFRTYADAKCGRRACI